MNSGLHVAFCAKCYPGFAHDGNMCSPEPMDCCWDETMDCDNPFETCRDNGWFTSQDCLLSPHLMTDICTEGCAMFDYYYEYDTDMWRSYCWYCEEGYDQRRHDHTHGVEYCLREEDFFECDVIDGCATCWESSSVWIIDSAGVDAHPLVCDTC